LLRLPVRRQLIDLPLTPHFALAGFRAAHDQFTAEEFFVMQLLDGTFCLFHRLHLHEGETFRALIMAIADDFGVLHMANAVE